MFERACLLVAVALGGCYTSHGRAELEDGSTGPACTFTVPPRLGAAVSCRIEPATSAPCEDAARCFCRAGSRMATDSDLRACVSSMLTPRGAITFADFCGAPPRHTLLEAIEGVYGPGAAQAPSPECSAIAAFADHL